MSIDPSNHQTDLRRASRTTSASALARGNGGKHPQQLNSLQRSPHTSQHVQHAQHAQHAQQQSVSTLKKKSRLKKNDSVTRFQYYQAFQIKQQLTQKQLRMQKQKQKQQQQHSKLHAKQQINTEDRKNKLIKSINTTTYSRKIVTQTSFKPKINAGKIPSVNVDVGQGGVAMIHAVEDGDLSDDNDMQLNMKRFDEGQYLDDDDHAYDDDAIMDENDDEDENDDVEAYENDEQENIDETDFRHHPIDHQVDSPTHSPSHDDVQLHSRSRSNAYWSTSSKLPSEAQAKSIALEQESDDSEARVFVDYVGHVGNVGRAGSGDLLHHKHMTLHSSFDGSSRLSSSSSSSSSSSWLSREMELGSIIQRVKRDMKKNTNAELRRVGSTDTYKHASNSGLQLKTLHDSHLKWHANEHQYEHQLKHEQHSSNHNQSQFFHENNDDDNKDDDISNTRDQDDDVHAEDDVQLDIQDATNDNEATEKYFRRLGISTSSLPYNKDTATTQLHAATDSMKTDSNSARIDQFDDGNRTEDEDNDNIDNANEHFAASTQKSIASSTALSTQTSIASSTALSALTTPWMVQQVQEKINLQRRRLHALLRKQHAQEK
jgi:hypothetical protein